jgi:hypothetical protein
MKRLIVLLSSLAVIAAAALAADINGTWKATAEGPNGSMERTFVFKVEGNKVTGETTSSMMGKSTISDGKIDGDAITFTITGKIGDNEMKLTYSGKIKDTEIVFQSSAGGGGQTIEWHARKQ